MSEQLTLNSETADGEKPKLRLLICGGRNYKFGVLDIAFLNDYRECFTIVEVVHGGATGADAEARIWAAWHSVPMREFKVNWRPQGQSGPTDRSAGPRRNSEMAQYVASHEDKVAGLVIAFPGGTGTDDMVRKAKAKGLQVVIAREEIARRSREEQKP